MSARSELWSAFEALTNSGDVSAISAVRCGRAKQHLLMKGNFGEPILLLSTEPRKTPCAFTLDEGLQPFPHHRRPIHRAGEEFHAASRKFRARRVDVIHSDRELDAGSGMGKRACHIGKPGDFCPG